MVRPEIAGAAAALVLAGAPVTTGEIADLPATLGLGPVKFCMSEPALLAASPGLRASRAPLDVARFPNLRPNPFVLSGLATPLPGCLFDVEVEGDRAGMSSVWLRLRLGDVEACAADLAQRWSSAYGEPRVELRDTQTTSAWRQDALSLVMWTTRGADAPWLDVTIKDLARAPGVTSHRPNEERPTCAHENEAPVVPRPDHG